MTELTANDMDDTSKIVPLLDQIAVPLASFVGVRAYHRESTYDSIAIVIIDLYYKT